MTLQPGFYKLRRGRPPFQSHHYLRVYHEQKKKYYILDNSIPMPVDKDTATEMHAGGYTIVKKITTSNPPQYHKIVAKIQFEDEEGAEFKMVARSGTVLEKIFEMFPRLKKTFWP